MSRSEDPPEVSTARTRPAGAVVSSEATDRRPIDALRGAAQVTAFWLAVTLPVLYVPPLWFGLSGKWGWIFLAVLLVHLVALAVGHDYNRR